MTSQHVSTKPQISRANDRAAFQSLAFQPAPQELEGTWFNTSPDSGEIGKIVIAVNGGSVSWEVFGIDAKKLIPWGTTTATPYVDRPGTSSVSGLIAEYDLGFVRTHLAANVKYGVLVIQSYNEFCDDSGRPPYFTREFFSREVEHRPPESPVPAGSGAIDLRHFVGEWTNTNAETIGITHFSFEADVDRYFIRAFGAGQPRVWGSAEVEPHTHSPADPHGCAFLARYDLGRSEVTLAANENKGLIIIASYHRPHDAKVPATYAREFFYRQEVVRR